MMFSDANLCSILTEEVDIRVEPYLKSSLVERGRLLSDYFKAEKMMFMVHEDSEDTKKKELKEIEKDAVFCSNLPEFFMLIANLRGYVQPLCKIGIDGNYISHTYFNQ